MTSASRKPRSSKGPGASAMDAAVAARRQLRVEDGLVAVAEWEAEHGALSEEELAAARARLDA